MHIRELKIPGAFEVITRQIVDDRGIFLEWYRYDILAEHVGHPLDLRQGNTSVSKKGVVRGIHFADLPPSQAKYVTVARGSIIDFVIDIRVGSSTFGQWDSVLLDDVDRKAIYISEGLGHAFVALEDETTVNYLVSDTFNPIGEHGINPMDPEIGLAFTLDPSELSLSAKDMSAPTLSEALSLGLLPTMEDVTAFYESLSQKER